MNHRIRTLSRFLPSFAIICSLFLLSSSPAAGLRSENASEGEKTVGGKALEEPEPFTFLDSTTVTARGHEAEVFGVSTPVSVLPLERLERRLPENAVDLLVELPGVDLQGVGRNQSRPVIRGQRGLRVLLLEDGFRLNHSRRQADFGEIAGIVEPNDLERVEVVRGPLSVLYGSDALGGVVNLISKDTETLPGEAVKGSLEFRYRSGGNLARLGLAASFDRTRWRAFLSGSLRNAGDYRSGTGEFGAIELARGITVEDTGIDDQALTAKFRYDLSSAWSASGQYRHYRSENAGFGFVEPSRIGSADPARVRIRIPEQRWHRIALGLDGAPRWSLADSVEVVGSYQRNERHLTNEVDVDLGPLFPGAPPSSLRVEARNWTDLATGSARVQLVRQLTPRSLWLYGLEALAESSEGADSSISSTRLRFPGPPFERTTVQRRELPNLPNARSSSAALFVQEEHSFGSRVKSTVGVRYQFASTEARPTRGWETSGLEFRDDRLVGAASLVASLTERLQFFLSYGMGFRAPSMVELLFEGPTPEGSGFQVRNPELGSERSGSFDLGARYRSGTISFEVVAFRNDLNDGIVQSYLTPAEIEALPPALRQAISASGARLVVEQRNLDRLRIEGVEVAAEFRNRRGLSGGLSYTYLDDQRLGISAEPVEGIYRERWTWHAAYQPRSGAWWLEYRGRYQRGNSLPVDPSIPLPAVGSRIPDFDLHHLGFGVTLHDGSQSSHAFTVAVENVSDRLYAEAANTSFFRPEPGREWVASYRLRF